MSNDNEPHDWISALAKGLTRRVERLEAVAFIVIGWILVITFMGVKF